MIRAYIGAGANLGEPLQQLRTARDALHELTNTEVIGESDIYRSAAIGPGEQGDYLNAVVALDTYLSAHDLLDALLAIEDRAGRRRVERWGARILDLDLLLYGEETIRSERLQLPHPRVYERNFVLEPLADLCPGNWCFPDGSNLSARRRDCPLNPLERTALCWHDGANAASRLRA
jgi:2-amino-4-hydroxy-6-hydroxymethyldihydropteridine diphosphokinase